MLMKNDSDNQLLFDFDAPPAPAVPATSEVQEITQTPEPAASPVPAAKDQPDKLFYLQAVLAYLAKTGVSGAALQVPCRMKKFKADVAGYYSCYEKRLNKIASTIAVDIYTRRSQCLPECAGQKAVLAELIELRQQRTAMEEVIRVEEPYLRAEDELFDEFRSYDYSRSANKDYHKLCRRIASLQQSLYKGTRMEQLAKADVADYLVIAVPENLLTLEEIPDDWGLWYIMPDRSIREMQTPARQECSEASRIHLVQNIGRAALNNVLFANGIKLLNSNKARFTRPPKARRK